MTAPATFQDKRIWLAGGALAAVIIVAAGWFLFISPKLSSASSMRSQTSSTEFQNTVLQAKTNQLRNESKNIGDLKSQLQTALAGLPTDSGLPQFTTEVSSIAATNAVKVTSITVGGLTAAAPGGAAPATPATGVATAGSVYALPVTILSTGPMPHQLAFITGIENGARRVLVNSTQVSVAAGAGSINSDVTVTVQLTLFSQPQTPQQVALLQKLLNATPTT
jgi:hypothetical protein